MSYIDSFIDFSSNTFCVVERNSAGIREFKEYPAEYTLYEKNLLGSKSTLAGDTVTTKKFGLYLEYKEAARQSASSITGENFKSSLLNKYYSNNNTTNANIAFFRCYSDNSGIHTVSLYLQWIKQLIVVSTLPASNKNTTYASSEANLLEQFLTSIDDVDILCGWNSDSNDIVKIVDRITYVLGETASNRLCLWNKTPVRKEYTKFGKSLATYKLFGRVHWDYLNLVSTRYPGSSDNKPFDRIDRDSRKSQDEIAELEVLALVEYESKHKLLSLELEIARACCIPLDRYCQPVFSTDSAITNYLTSNNVVYSLENKPAYSKKISSSTIFCKPGMFSNVGIINFDYLFPNVIRSFNLGFTDNDQARPTSMLAGFVSSMLDNKLHSKTARKVIINRLVGCTLSEHSNFYNPELFDKIVKISNKLLSGVVEYLESRGVVVPYVDTDQIYFTVNATCSMTEQEIADFYKDIVDDVKGSLTQIISNNISTPLADVEGIKISLGNISTKTLFVGKKKLASLDFHDSKIIDPKNRRVFTRGLATSRNDIAPHVKELLNKFFLEELEGRSGLNLIKEFKNSSQDVHAYKSGRICRFSSSNNSSVVNNSVSNWVHLKRKHNDYQSLDIVPGSKICVCQLLPNSYGFLHIAYPLEQTLLPSWFVSLPFDTVNMKEEILTRTLGETFKVLRYEL